MAVPRPVPYVRLFAGLLSGDADLLARARQLLTRVYGPVELASEIWPFDQSDYYESEMGPSLLRCFVSFERRVRADELAQIKHDTNDLELRLADDCVALGVVRPVNIDPGYVDLGKLVLATTKDRSHRVCIGQGIFAEVTLHYTEGAWQPWPWTYPDYRQPAVLAYFTDVRARLLAQRRQDAEHVEPGHNGSGA